MANLNMSKYITSFLNKILKLIKICLNVINKNKTLRIFRCDTDENYRSLIYLLSNYNLLNQKEGLEALFYTLTGDDRFKAFGSKKIIMTSVMINGKEVAYHCNVLITEYTTFEEYYNKIRNYVQKHYDGYYGVEVISIYKVRVWCVDHLSNRRIKSGVKSPKQVYKYSRSYSTSTVLSSRDAGCSIKPLKHHKFMLGSEAPFGTMDVETMLINNIQIPVAISAVHHDIRKIFLIDKELLKIDLDKAVDELWSNYFEFVLKFRSSDGYTVFVHNLGDFDGLFLHKALTRYADPDRVKSLIDHSNTFIINSYVSESGESVVWKDSYRIFPISLDELCNVFKVSGKISKYNQEFNNIDKIFSNYWNIKNFKDYALQDSRSLYNALRKAQNEYFDKYQVDITSIFSTSSLSLKIFRANFLNEDITILTGKEDEFVRRGYLGGATDYYKAYARHVFYYDVNSLYPYAMKMILPNKPIRRYNDMSDIKLENFFGFTLAEIHCPNSVPIPLLPYKDPETNRTIHPRGTWQGVYYSEELKAVSKLGYQIKLLEGTEFSQFRPFDDYIDHFYDLKKNSTGGTRFIAKMQLNQLYGIFGRRQELIRSVNTNDITKYAHFKIKSVIDSGSDWSTLLLVDRKYPDQTVTNLSDLFEQNNDHKIIKSNVAIAAAVTANARLIMNVYKIAAGDSLMYTDTDSIFTTKPLDTKLVGKALGMMKDELNGKVIDEAYFFGIKKYAYRIGDEVFSVFAGIKRNSLTWQNVLDINNSKTVESLQKNVFFNRLLISRETR